MTRGIWKVEAGDAAPQFELPATGATSGRGGSRTRVRLDAYRGRNVVLVFTPAAFTPV